jgi:flavin-binding protein dodecin
MLVLPMLDEPERCSTSGTITAALARNSDGSILVRWPCFCSKSTREAEMAVASVSKITAASPTSFDAAVQEGLARANKTLRGITGLHVIEQKASVKGGRIDEYRVTMEVTFILEG